jgi:hypothetical protein
MYFRYVFLFFVFLGCAQKETTALPLSTTKVAASTQNTLSQADLLPEIEAEWGTETPVIGISRELIAVNGRKAEETPKALLQLKKSKDSKASPFLIEHLSSALEEYKASSMAVNGRSVVKKALIVQGYSDVDFVAYCMIFYSGAAVGYDSVSLSILQKDAASKKPESSVFVELLSESSIDASTIAVSLQEDGFAISLDKEVTLIKRDAGYNYDELARTLKTFKAENAGKKVSILIDLKNLKVGSKNVNPEVFFKTVEACNQTDFAMGLVLQL